MVNSCPPLDQSGVGAIALVSVLTSRAQALQVQVYPTEPQLGDTISLIMQSDTGVTPTVLFQQESYPAFPIGGNRYRALLPTTPLDPPGRLEIQVNDGSETRNLALGLRDRDFPTQRITVRGGGSGGTDFEFDRVAAFKALVTPEKIWNGAFVRPNAGEITSVYGVRRYYNGVFANDYYHKGVDYGGGTGSAVVAPAAGRVVLVGREADGFVLHGNTVGVDHGQGVSSIFLHLSRINVAEGDFVEAGQTIGAVGATGSATGPHLHWGLYVHGKSVDPVPWRYDGFE
ncbi:MAG: M23 family metallopeptidase [Leptolyngbyaceae cyanobacterium SL_7_1]|nr:M23 family metallopeptidase [Leptolyngbyaceae cyanobacterium SL_7_1]